MRSFFLTLAVMLSAMPARADEPFPPGLEPLVVSLISSPELPEGWTLGRASIGATAIEIGLNASAVEREVVVLRRLGAAPAPGEAALGESRRFTIAVRPADAPREPAERLARQIITRDDGTTALPVASGDAPDGHVSAKERSIDRILRTIRWIALAALAVAVLRRVGRRQLLITTLVTIFAALVRFTVPTPGPVHSNGHGVAEMRGLVGAPGHDDFSAEADRYGGAHGQFAREALRPFQGSARAVFTLHGLASSLSVGLLFALALALGLTEGASLAAAAALALWPAHVQLGVSESAMVLAGLWMLVGTVAALAFVRADRGESRLAWLSALAFAMSAEQGVTTLALPAAGLLLVLSVAPRVVMGRWRMWLGPALLLGAVMVRHAWLLAPVFAETQRRRPGTLELPHGLALLKRLLLFDGALGVGFALIAAVALALALKRRPRLTLPLLVVVIVALLPGLYVGASLTDRLRYQTVPLSLAALFIALALDGADRLRTGLAAIGVLIVLLPGLRALARSPLLDVAAHAQVARAALPEAFQLKLPPRRMGARGEVIAEFPEYLLSSHRIDYAASNDARADHCFVYLGPACWSFTEEELSSPDTTRVLLDGLPIRSECRALVPGEGLLKDPRAQLARVEVPWRKAEFHRIPAERPLVGFVPCR